MMILKIDRRQTVEEKNLPPREASPALSTDIVSVQHGMTDELRGILAELDTQIPEQEDAPLTPDEAAYAATLAMMSDVRARVYEPADSQPSRRRKREKKLPEDLQQSRRVADLSALLVRIASPEDRRFKDLHPSFRVMPIRTGDEALGLYREIAATDDPSESDVRAVLRLIVAGVEADDKASAPLFTWLKKQKKNGLDLRTLLDTMRAEDPLVDAECRDLIDEQGIYRDFYLGHALRSAIRRKANPRGKPRTQPDFDEEDTVLADDDDDRDAVVEISLREDDAPPSPPPSRRGRALRPPSPAQAPEPARPRGKATARVAERPAMPHDVYGDYVAIEIQLDALILRAEEMGDSRMAESIRIPRRLIAAILLEGRQ